MLEKNKVTQIFRRAAASGLAVLCFGAFAECGDKSQPEPVAQPAPINNDSSINICDSRNHTPEKAVPLTAGEVAFVRSIFGKTLDTAPERKYLLGTAQSYEYSGMTCARDGSQGKNVEFYGTNRHSNDYSREKIDKYGYFIHEMTHVWQFQTWSAAQLADHCTIYKYTLDAEHAFSSYCDEQQGYIVTDYARHFLHPDHGNARWYLGISTPESYALLAKVVEDQFPEARKTRTALEAKEKAKKLAGLNS